LGDVLFDATLYPPLYAVRPRHKQFRSGRGSIAYSNPAPGTGENQLARSGTRKAKCLEPVAHSHLPYGFDMTFGFYGASSAGPQPQWTPSSLSLSRKVRMSPLELKSVSWVKTLMVNSFENTTAAGLRHVSPVTPPRRWSQRGASHMQRALVGVCGSGRKSSVSRIRLKETMGKFWRHILKTSFQNPHVFAEVQMWNFMTWDGDPRTCCPSQCRTDLRLRGDSSVGSQRGRTSSA